MSPFSSSVITLSIFVFGATDRIDNHLRYFLFSLPKLSNSNIVAREPISSIEGRRRSFFSLGWPASTTERVPPLFRTTSMGRLRPISVLLCRVPEVPSNAVVISDVTQHSDSLSVRRPKYSSTCSMTAFLLSVAPTSVLIQSSCSGGSLASGMTRWLRASPVSFCKLKRQKLLDGETACRFVPRRRHSHTLWFLADVVGLFSINVVSFSRNVVLRDPLFSANLVPKRGCYRFEPIMFSVRYSYWASSRHVRILSCSTGTIASPTSSRTIVTSISSVSFTAPSTSPDMNSESHTTTRCHGRPSRSCSRSWSPSATTPSGSGSSSPSADWRWR